MKYSQANTNGADLGGGGADQENVGIVIRKNWNEFDLLIDFKIWNCQTI